MTINASDAGSTLDVKEDKFAVLIEKYKIFCYHFGKYIDQTPRNDIAKSLYQADVVMTPGMFVGLTMVTAFIVAFVVFCISFILFFNSASPFVYISVLTILAFGLTVGGFPFTLYNQISARNMEIDHELPYVISYMSILASAGSTPMDIIRRVAVEDYGAISNEFGKVMYRVDVLGEDGITALNHLISNASSELFRAICIDISNAIQSGGGLRTYLEMKSKELLEMRWKNQKQFVESLSIYGEGYLSGVVMSVVMVVLMIVVTSALGLELGPIRPKQLFNLFVYILLPFINILFFLLVWMKYSRSAV